MFCAPLKPPVNINKLVKTVFSKYDIYLQIIGSVSSDGAPSTLGNHSCFVALTKRVIPIFAKTMPAKFKKTLDSSVTIVNLI